jgi:hypothetical protein
MVFKESCISDDEFDVVEAVEPVSDLSTPTDQSSQPQDLPGGHYGRPFDGGQPLAPTQQHVVASDTRSSLNNSYRTASTWMKENDEIDSGNGEGNSVLQYTKSVVQRFYTGQDLLIAVMGYGSIYSW